MLTILLSKMGKLDLTVFSGSFSLNILRVCGEKYRLWMQPVSTALDTQQSVSTSETNICKGVSAHVAGSTTQGTYLLS